MPVVVLFFCFDFYPFLPDVSAQGLSGTSEAMPDLPSACVPVAFLLFLKVFSFSLQLPSQLGYVSLRPLSWASICCCCSYCFCLSNSRSLSAASFLARSSAQQRFQKEKQVTDETQTLLSWDQKPNQIWKESGKSQNSPGATYQEQVWEYDGKGLDSGWCPTTTLLFSDLAVCIPQKKWKLIILERSLFDLSKGIEWTSPPC